VRAPSREVYSYGQALPWSILLPHAAGTPRVAPSPYLCTGEGGTWSQQFSNPDGNGCLRLNTLASPRQALP